VLTGTELLVGADTAGGAALVVVTHDLTVVRACDRVTAYWLLRTQLPTARRLVDDPRAVRTGR